LEGTDIYGNAVVVMVTGKENSRVAKLCLAETLSSFIVLMKWPGLWWNTEGHKKKNHETMFLASLPDKI